MIAALLAAGAVDIYAADPTLVDSEEALFARPAEKVELFALRGEYEPVLLALRSDAAVECRLEVSELVCGGARLPSECVEVARLEWAENLFYRRDDWVLKPSTEVRLEAGGIERLWVTFRVPESARPGNYRGRIRLSFDGGSRDLPVELDVLPARLSPCGKRFYLLSTVSPYGQYFNPAKKAALRPEVVEFYRGMKEHGMTGACIKCSDWPYKGSIGGLEAEIEAALEAGLDGEVIWNMKALIDAAKGGDRYDFNGRMDNWDEKKDLARLRGIFLKVKKLVLGRGWPEVIFYVIDEPGTQFDEKTFLCRSMDILLKASRAVDSYGGRAHSTITECIDEKHNRAPRWSRYQDEMRLLWDKCRPFLHVRNYGYGYPQGKTNVFHERDDARARGHEVWFYNNAAVLGRNRFCARVYWGLWGWKVGADGLTAWTHPRARTVQYELCREGIDDAKYLALIERLCLALLPDDPARKEAEEFLDRLKVSVKLDANGFVGSWADVVGGAAELARPGEGGWRVMDFSSLKRALAEQVRRLTEAQDKYPAGLQELRKLASGWKLDEAWRRLPRLVEGSAGFEGNALRFVGRGLVAAEVLMREAITTGKDKRLGVRLPSSSGRKRGTVRARIVSANLRRLSVNFMGRDDRVAWKDVPPEELYHMCLRLGLRKEILDAFAYSFLGGGL